MNGEERIYSVLVVCSVEKFNAAMPELLPPSRYNPVCYASSVAEAKRNAAEYSYDFVIINSPLPDEMGTRFAIDICHTKTSVALMLLKSDDESELHERVFSHGVFTLCKPTSRSMVTTALDWMASVRERLRAQEEKNRSVEDRMEEIRTVNRAKLLLISESKMTEPEAHRYIEKKAMDTCATKLDAAKEIIRLYS